jgi:hypothetical protein
MTNHAAGQQRAVVLTGDVPLPAHAAREVLANAPGRPAGWYAVTFAADGTATWSKVDQPGPEGARVTASAEEPVDRPEGHLQHGPQSGIVPFPGGAYRPGIGPLRTPEGYFAPQSPARRPWWRRWWQRQRPADPELPPGAELW